MNWKERLQGIGQKQSEEELRRHEDEQRRNEPIKKRRQVAEQFFKTNVVPGLDEFVKTFQEQKQPYQIQTNCRGGTHNLVIYGAEDTDVIDVDFSIDEHARIWFEGENRSGKIYGPLPDNAVNTKEGFLNWLIDQYEKSLAAGPE